MNEKLCKKCGETKPINQFTKHSKTYDGLYFCCRECKNNNRKFSESDRNRSPEDPDKAKERMIRFKENNPGYFSRKALEWQKLNPEKVRTSKRKRTLNGKDAIDSHKRRAKAQSLPRDFTLSDWENVLSYFDYSCAYCGKSRDNLQMEHVIPLNKFGAFTPSNIIPACSSCNASKRDRDLLEWYSQRPYYSELRYKKVMDWTNNHALRNGKKLSEKMGDANHIAVGGTK